MQVSETHIDIAKQLAPFVTPTEELERRFGFSAPSYDSKPRYKKNNNGFLAKIEIPFFENALGYRGRQSRSNLSEQQAPLLSHETSSRHLPENPTALDHIRLLFGNNGLEPLVFSLRRMSDPSQRNAVFEDNFNARKSIKTANNFARKWINKLMGEADVYVSQSSYIWESERTGAKKATFEHLDSTRVLFVDLDIYNTNTQVSPEVAANQILAKCEAANCPKPLIINSGRGLYLIWVLKELLLLKQSSFKTSIDYARWKEVQAKLMLWLEDFAPDKKVSDLTRVLRLIGTKNSKSGTIVSVLYDDGQKTTLGSLEKAMHRQGIVLSKELKEKNTQSTAAKLSDLKHKLNDSDKYQARKKHLKQLREILKADTKKASELKYVRHHYFLRYQDVINLICKRGGISHGLRDETVLWACALRFLSGLMKAKELASFAGVLAQVSEDHLNCYSQGYLSSLERRMFAFERMAQEINSQVRHTSTVVDADNDPHLVLSNPRPNAKIRLGFGDSYLSGPVYTPSIDTLITRLRITDSEFQHLKVLVPQSVKQARRYKKSATHQRAARRKKLKQEQYHALYETEVIDGKSLSLSVKGAQVSRSALHRYLQTAPALGLFRHKRKIVTQCRARKKHLSIEFAKTLMRVIPNISVRSLAKAIGHPKSTVHYWIKKGQIEFNTSKLNISAFNSTKFTYIQFNKKYLTISKNTAVASVLEKIGIRTKPYASAISSSVQSFLLFKSSNSLSWATGKSNKKAGTCFVKYAGPPVRHQTFWQQGFKALPVTAPLRGLDFILFLKKILAKPCVFDLVNFRPLKNYG